MKFSEKNPVERFKHIQWYIAKQYMQNQHVSANNELITINSKFL